MSPLVSIGPGVLLLLKVYPTKQHSKYSIAKATSGGKNIRITDIDKRSIGIIREGEYINPNNCDPGSYIEADKYTDSKMKK